MGGKNVVHLSDEAHASLAKLAGKADDKHMSSFLEGMIYNEVKRPQGRSDVRAELDRIKSAMPDGWVRTVGAGGGVHFWPINEKHDPNTACDCAPVTADSPLGIIATHNRRGVS